MNQWINEAMNQCPHGRVPTQKILIDAFTLFFYDHFDTGKEVIQKFMSSNHSEVAET